MTTYLLDANVFIQAKNLHYGFEFCPAFWDWLDQANAAGSVFSIERVGDELLAGDDELAAWARQRPGLFLAPDTTMVPSLTTVSTWASGSGYEPTGVATFLQVADYYLVAQALAHQYVVVTHEVFSHSPKKIKIPNACIGVGVKSVNPYEMLRTERAKFVLGRPELPEGSTVDRVGRVAQQHPKLDWSDPEGAQETLAILADPVAMADLEEAESDIATGNLLPMDRYTPRGEAHRP